MKSSDRKTQNEKDKDAAARLAHAVTRSIEDRTIERLLGEQAEEVDQWIKKQNDPKMYRFGALQRLILIGLRA